MRTYIIRNYECAPPALSNSCSITVIFGTSGGSVIGHSIFSDLMSAFLFPQEVTLQTGTRPHTCCLFEKEGYLAVHLRFQRVCPRISRVSNGGVRMSVCVCTCVCHTGVRGVAV